MSRSERPLINTQDEAVHQVDRALPALSVEEKLMIHDSQLCFNSNRRLATSEGQPARRRCETVAGRNRDKVTSVCNSRPRERRMGDTEARGCTENYQLSMFNPNSKKESELALGEMK